MSAKKRERFINNIVGGKQLPKRRLTASDFVPELYGFLVVCVVLILCSDQRSGIDEKPHFRRSP